jgi:diacylglycerol kinase (ATP)
VSSGAKEPGALEPVQLPPNVKAIRDSRAFAAFDYAFQGILYATRTQRNMRIHLVVAALAMFACLYLRLERAYVAVVVICIALVIALELVNTAIEAIVDLTTSDQHPLAKVAKDAAAGAVLVVAMGATIVGYLAFYEGVTATGAKVSYALATIPRNYVFVTLVIVGVGTIFAKAFAGRHGTPLQGGAISGHAALSAAAATMIALLSGNLVIGVIAFFLAFLVSQSRVEAGIHSFAETGFGAILGTCVSIALFMLVHA